MSKNFTKRFLQTIASARVFKFIVAFLLTTVLSVSSYSQGIKVLLIGADQLSWVNDVKTKLQATGAFSQIDVRENGNFPNLATISTYDAVLVWGDNSLSVGTLGNDIATYIENGGGVVYAVFGTSYSASGSLGLDGNFRTRQYYLISSTGQANLGGGTMVKVLPNHDLLAGVNTFNGGSSGYRSNNGTVINNSTVAATWSDGKPLIVFNDNIGPAHARRVDLDFFPPSSTVRGDFWTASTDGAIIMKNALLYVATPIVTDDPKCITTPTVNFSLSSTTNISSVVWDFGDGSATVNSLTTSHTYATAGSFTASALITYSNSTTHTYTKTVKIDDLSVGGTAASDQTIASNTSPANISLTGNTGSIQWQVSTNNSTWSNISGATSTPLTSAQMGSIAANRYYRAVVTSGACSSVNSNVVTVSVGTPPTISSISNVTVCSGSASNAQSFTVGDAETPVASLTLSGTSSNTSLIPNANITFGGTGANRTVSVTSAAGQSGTATITVTVTDGDNSTATSSFTVTVNALPTVTAISNQTVCNGAATTAVTFAGTNVSSYSWTNNTTSIGLAASGTGAGIPSFTAVNTGSTPVTATVSVTATSNNVTNLNYTIYSTHGGNGNTSQYPINPATLTELNALFNTANSNTVVSSTGTASANTLFNWTTYTTLTAAGISIPNSGDYFAVKATGTFTPAETGTYTFAVDGDDAVDVSIDGTVVCSYYGGHPFGGWHTGTINLVAGNSYSFVARMQEGGGGEGLKVAWKRPSQSSYSLQPSEFGTTCTSAVTTFTITVNPNIVTTVPNQVVASGNATNAITFSGAGTGATYNWTNNNTNVIPVSGGSGNIASFVTTNTGTAPQVATFSVTATATNGGVTCTGPASTFTITVNPAPTMVQPTNYTYANATTTSAIAFSSLNTGGTTTYAWTNSNTAIGLAASGSGNVPSFTATNAGTAPISATITVTPTYTNGGVSAAGSAYTFTITINPTAQVNTVSNQTVCNGAATTAVTFGTVNTGGTTTYAWTNNTTSIGLAASGSGNIASFTATNTGTAPVTATITVTPSYTNAGLTTAGTATTFTITVNPTATVNAVSNQTVCNGAATTAVTFGSPVSGATYAWTNSNTAIGLAASGTGNLASFTGTNATTAPITGTITVTPTANGCVGTASTFTITVNPTATVNAISNQTVCNGASTTAVTFAGPVAGTTYAWSNNTTSIGLAASGAGNIAAFTATNTGTTVVTATITVTPTANSCVGTPSTFTIAVNPTPTVASVANQTVCNNASTTAVNFTGAVTGTTYSWTNNTTSIGLAASGTGNIAAFTATNVTTAPITATITVTPSFGGCAGSPTSFTITVNPTATVNTIANQVLCNGSNTTAVTFAGPVAGTTYAWTNTTTGIGLVASGSGTGIASFATTNATTAPLVGTITVTPTANGCVGTPRTFTITVNPIPTVSAVASQVLCHGSTTGAVTFAGAVTGTVYSWTNSAPSIGLAASGTGNIASFTATNTGSSPVIATITVTPSFTNGGVTCTGAPTTFTITVNPLPVVSAGTLPSRICISDTLVALSGTPTGGYWSGIGVHGFNFLPATAAIGSFTLTYRYTDANNCTNSSNITATVLECAERNRTLGAGAVSLYPNPNNGSFNLKVNSSLFNNLSMRVYNASGNLVSTKQWTGLVYGRLINVNLTNLPTGIYVVRLYYGDGIDAGAETAYRVIIGH
jgi:hypothetical protein